MEDLVLQAESDGKPVELRLALTNIGNVAVSVKDDDTVCVLEMDKDGADAFWSWFDQCDEDMAVSGVADDTVLRGHYNQSTEISTLTFYGSDGNAMATVKVADRKLMKCNNWLYEYSLVVAPTGEVD